jgi:hypothetical protein
MELTVFVSAVIISLVLLYTMREVRISLGKISADIQDLKNASNKS